MATCIFIHDHCSKHEKVQCINMHTTFSFCGQNALVCVLLFVWNVLLSSADSEAVTQRRDYKQLLDQTG